MPRQDTPRAKLHWETLDTITKGKIKVGITAAAKQDGNKIYSIRIGKMLTEDKTTGFYNPSDFANLRAAIDEAEAWIDTDRHETRNKNNMKNRRS